MYARRVSRSKSPVAVRCVGERVCDVITISVPACSCILALFLSLSPSSSFSVRTYIAPGVYYTEHALCFRVCVHMHVRTRVRMREITLLATDSGLFFFRNALSPSDINILYNKLPLIN